MSNEANIKLSSSNFDNLTSSVQRHSESESENDLCFIKSKIRLKQINESDSDSINVVGDEFESVSLSQKSDSDDSNTGDILYKKKKSRIRKLSNSGSESDSNNGGRGLSETNKNDLSRTKIKNKKLQDKFKKLKQSKSHLKENIKVSPNISEDEDRDISSDGEISCVKIKQKIKKKSSHTLTSICDPDTSEEESNVNVKPFKSKPTSIKLIPPKPVRISAKEALENMQKIKSESNRMLREKEVSLPYHRPKALTLKDIMNRRKPAVTSDGKSLPIKMNNEQLRQYAIMLDQRQKEMMELCKSDSDGEEENSPETEVPIDNPDKSEDIKVVTSDQNTSINEENIPADINDSIFDEVTAANKMDDNKCCRPVDQSSKEVIIDNEQHTEESVNGQDNYNENSSNENMEKEEPPVLAVNSLSQLNDKNIIAEYTTEKNKEPVLTTAEDSLLSLNNLAKENVDEIDIQDSEVTSKGNAVDFIDLNKGTEEESQIISLQYDSEKTEFDSFHEKANDCKVENITAEILNDSNNKKKLLNETNGFSDDDFTMDEIDNIIVNAEQCEGKTNKGLLSIEATLELKPVLTGAPGMVIDLDDSEVNTRKLTGVELLKEQFTYFARLKTFEETEKEREKKFKPGVQHLKLKQELEEQIAEQRSLEWEKRLQAENQLQAELNADEKEQFDGEDIEKIEAKLSNEVTDDDEESSSEEELEEVDMYNIKEKPRIRNPLVDDEAEVSDDDNIENNDEDVCNEKENDVEEENNDGSEEDIDSNDDDEDSSESEEEVEETKCRKGRILKAFEDSDEEDSKAEMKQDNAPMSENKEMHESQDEEIQLAQPQKTSSDDLFTSEECTQKSTNTPKDADRTLDLGSQTFSILNTGNDYTSTVEKMDTSTEKLDIICETQLSDVHFEAIAGMCTGGFSQNIVTPQAESSQLSQSQLGDDVAALCTGKFYDNPFLSQLEPDVGKNDGNEITDESINESTVEKSFDDINTTDNSVALVNAENSQNSDVTENTGKSENIEKIDNSEKSHDLDKTEHTVSNKIREENNLLKSIIDELGDPEFDAPKQNKYFFNDNGNQDTANSQGIESSQFKKKFVIESDDESNAGAQVIVKKKKHKKRKLENRALQISDDEEEEDLEAEEDVYESDIEEDNDRLVEYDSEENEVLVQTKVSKKKHRGKEFFEQEAELTSEDEWIGSGDEDEAGLDRMEREAGDDDTFHQGRLQRELGEIHMREVLDQDKREVRLLQELLFEDGDLGDGHRQRKFRWKNTDGDEEDAGTNPEDYADTQEEEFESEEQWRKQRHERELFLRSMQEKDGKEDANVSISRSAFIKASLTSKASPNATKESIFNASRVENLQPLESSDKRAANNIPSPKKPFIMCQQNYHNSFLTRGRGALARLAALATPLAGDGDDIPKVNASANRGNFVFAAITPPATKVTKRKAEVAPETPRLLKKMKQEMNKSSKSILDHL